MTVFNLFVVDVSRASNAVHFGGLASKTKWPREETWGDAHWSGHTDQYDPYWQTICV